ncbi:MAG: dephospho-CoA kinase [Nonlabens sp.]|uniref:dephospho-CoA kinase n=1 Tax=Nonlabens sp. TaxID=1888209 RepID=UPI003EF89201
MRIIGLTGGIGSGKTTVAREFEKLGIPLYIADDRSKELLSCDNEVKKAVKNLLGPDSYITEGDREVANRPFIASKVFNDKSLLEGLNAILHPAVRLDFKQFCKTQSNAPFIIYEAAILFESGGYLNCDEVILVTAPIEERIKRVMARDGVKREEVIARMNHQWDEIKKLQGSNFVIINDNLESIPCKVNNVYQFLLIND